MPITKYFYLKKYTLPRNYPIKTWCENSFCNIEKHEIEECEQMMEFKFPISLKEFWLEIGYGHLTTPKYHNDNYICAYKNYILHPLHIANIILYRENSDYILPDAAEDLEEGDIPFFEIGDMSSFLYMKRFSDNPDAVYDFGGILIEEHFERFIYRLYHESPNYYMKNW